MNRRPLGGVSVFLNIGDNMPDLSLERVDEGNFEEFFQLIVELANFEKLVPPDESGKRRLKEHGRSPHPYYEGYIARLEGKAVAYLILTTSYSSFLAKPTLYIEDVYVQEIHRKGGIGKRMFQFSAERADELGCGRMEWHVLDWNTNAQRFYSSIGARHLDEWFYFRLDEEGIKKMGKRV